MHAIEERFWAKVDQQNRDKCWKFKGCLNKDGYGKFSIGYVEVKAHQLAWMSYNEQDIPKGKCILHHCDNRACCNPAHLYCGTQADNTKDMMNRGRNTPKGSRSLCAKDILVIRKLRPDGPESVGSYNRTQELISKIFNISTRTIRRVWASETYPCKEGYFV